MAVTSIRSSVLTIAVLALVCLLAGWYWFKPQWAGYSETQELLQAEEAKNAELEATLASIKTFLESYDKQAVNMGTVSLALPRESLNSADFIGNLGDLAQASGLALSNLQLGDSSASRTASPNTILAQKVTFTATGSYPAFKDFMLRLENHLRLVDVQHISVKQDDSGQLDYQVDLTTYYQK